jgi:glycosyltransferase involved in cell wall biosynthesis
MVKVSVCIPTYNYGHFIGEAIESVLRQTFQDFEIIITDNASTDNTEAIVSKLSETDPRIRYERNPSNLGMVANWNRCLSLATGDYVKILCADDLLKDGCLDILSALLDRNPSAALASSARGLITGGDCSEYLAFSDKEEAVEGPECIRRMLIKGNIIGEPSAVLFRRICGSRGFDPAYQQLTDMEFWLHLLQHGGFVFSPEVLCLYRQHEGMETKKNIKSVRIYTEGRRLFSVYGVSPGVKLNGPSWIFCSMRPMLAFLYCWLYARFTRSNKHIGARNHQPGR